MTPVQTFSHQGYEFDQILMYFQKLYGSLIGTMSIYNHQYPLLVGYTSIVHGWIPTKNNFFHCVMLDQTWDKHRKMNSYPWFSSGTKSLRIFRMGNITVYLDHAVALQTYRTFVLTRYWVIINLLCSSLTGRLSLVLQARQGTPFIVLYRHGRPIRRKMV